MIWERFIPRKGKKPRRVETTRVPIKQLTRTWQQYVRDLACWGFAPCMVKDPAHKGEEFARWKARIEAIGYAVGIGVFNAADYGDPTSRRRLFIQCVRRGSGLRIVWPTATHMKPNAQRAVDPGKRPWRTALEILDRSDLGKSIFDRPKQLAPKTLRRILIGLLTYGLDPFLTPGFGEREGQVPRTHSVKSPIPTIAASGHLHLASPVPIPVADGLGAATYRCTSCGEWLWQAHLKCPSCQSSQVASAAAAAFIVPREGVFRGNQPYPLTEPVKTVISVGAGHLAQTFILPQQRQGRQVKSAHEPVSPLTSKGAEAIVTPKYLVQFAHGNEAGKEDDARRAKSLDAPLPALTGSQEYAVASSFLLPQQRGVDTRPVTSPVPTIAAKGHTDMVTTALIKLKGTGTANDPYLPLGAVGASGLHHAVTRHVLIQTAHSGADASRVKSVMEPLAAIAGNRGDPAVISFSLPSIPDGPPREARLILNGLRPGGTGRPVLEVGDDRYEIDIFFRMLNVRELARAQGFPEHYEFFGSKTDAVKQIGNAVPGCLAEALTIAAISQCEDIRPYQAQAA